MAITDKMEQPMTYAIYKTWDEGEICEVDNGEIFNMSPSSPNLDHQRISGSLNVEFKTYLKGKSCEVFTAPVDVYLFEDASNDSNDDNINSWVVPDLLVVCDKNKLRKHGIVGCPDLTIEILSPSTAKNDRLKKKKMYERAGVKEYWIVDPLYQKVEVYLLKNNNLILNNIYNKEDSIQVSIFNDLTIDLNDIFPQVEE